jgi:hypothetical protein
MSDEQVPEDVREFILRYINSIAQLEALLLLWRDPNATWEIASLAKRLYASEGETSEALAQMNADGLLVADEGRYRFNPRCSDREKEMVARLAQVYAKQLIPVTNIIHTKPGRIREFADAFRLRKDQ